MSRRVMAVSIKYSPRGPSRWRRSCSQSGFQKRKRSNLSFYERGGAVKVFELIALSLRSKPSSGGASSTTLQTQSPSPTRHSLIALPGRVQPSQHTLLSRSCFTPPHSPVAWNAEPHSCPARRRSLCLRTPQSLAREQSPTPNSLPTPCCPRGGADYLPPWCSRYPTSAPTALPIASRHFAPGTLPLPPRRCRSPPALARTGAPGTPPLAPRRCRLSPALVRLVPHLCPDGTADCLPPLCARYPTSSPAAVPVASRTGPHWCSRYPTSAPAAVPIASPFGAPGAPPLPTRRCRLHPALARPAPRLCGAPPPYGGPPRSAQLTPPTVSAALSCDVLPPTRQLPPPALALIGLCRGYSRSSVSTAYPADSLVSRIADVYAEGVTIVCRHTCTVFLLSTDMCESCTDTIVTHHSFLSSPSPPPNTISTVSSNIPAFSSAPSHADTPLIKSSDWVPGNGPSASVALSST